MFLKKKRPCKEKQCLPDTEKEKYALIIQVTGETELNWITLKVKQAIGELIENCPENQNYARVKLHFYQYKNVR